MTTDYYKLCEDGLIAFLISDLPLVFPNGAKQVTASDDTVIDNGNDYYAITYPGSFPQTELTEGFVVYSWEILLDVMSRWKKTESKAWNENGFKYLRSEIIYLINHTRAGRSLNKTLFVQEAVLSANDSPSYVPLRGTDPGNPVFTHIRQVCMVTVRQLVPREQ